MSSTLVSICCLAYNHDLYIRECLDSFLMQKTNFQFEVLIHDDASTDNTAKIIKEYELKFPDIIKPIYQTENQYSKGISISKTFNFPRVKGKYIALCEGDDYWTDPLKLQKQVDFLEENPEFGLCHGDCHFFYADKEKWQLNVNRNLSNNIDIKDKKEIFYRLIDGDYKIRTATVLFKKELLDKIKLNDQTFLMGDTPLWLDFSQITKFKYFDEVFSVYRILPESASNSRNKIKKLKFKMSMAEMRVYYCKKYGYPINTKLKKRYNSSLITLKIFDNEYQSKHSLINPTKQEKFIYNYSSNMVVRILFKLKIRSAKYINLIGRKINIVS